MSTTQKINPNYEVPFKSQKELQNCLINKFAKHGSKVKYKVTLNVSETQA